MDGYDELMARLRPLAEVLAEMFSVDELERLEQGGGPLVFWLLDADGLPTGGVIFDPDTRRRTKFQLPIAGKAVA